MGKNGSENEQVLQDLDEVQEDGSGQDVIIKDHLPYFSILMSAMHHVQLAMLNEEDGGITALIVLLSVLPPKLRKKAEDNGWIEYWNNQAISRAHHRVKNLGIKYRGTDTWVFQSGNSRRAEIVTEVARDLAVIVEWLEGENLLWKARIEAVGGEL